MVAGGIKPGGKSTVFLRNEFTQSNSLQHAVFSRAAPLLRRSLRCLLLVASSLNFNQQPACIMHFMHAATSNHAQWLSKFFRMITAKQIQPTREERIWIPLPPPPPPRIRSRPRTAGTATTAHHHQVGPGGARRAARAKYCSKGGRSAREASKEGGSPGTEMVHFPRHQNQISCPPPWSVHG